MSIEIREAKNEDISSLSTIIKTSFYDVAIRFNLTSKNCPTHPSNCTDESIVSALDKGIKFFILEEEHDACGCVAIEQADQNVFYIEKLAVLPKNRKKGNGAALIDHAIKKSKEFLAKRVEIGIINENIELKKWYEKIGFIFRETAYYKHLPFTVAFMFMEIR